MHVLDYLVLIVYFLAMTGIGFWSMRRIKGQEDFFMGGRGFGKLIQTFAAFGAGTNASAPAVTASTTYHSGMSGMWSVMYWLWVTPIYWFSGLWYRRMRHLTLGDWFVERYESQRLGAAYAVFGVLYYILYSSMAFSAIGKVAAPLMQQDTVNLLGMTFGIEYVLVPIIGVVILIYGLAGGLQAAYYTDLIQGLCIILLSVILIPYGMTALVERFGDPGNQSWYAGFQLMHQQLPAEHFQVVGSQTSEFPLHRILAVVVINLIGIVVTPHMIATGGGSAKTETDARIGLVTGNLLKRFCTVGWVLTSLVALALYADSPELANDPDKTWGVASRELLGPGLTGLMLACLLAALMSSVDTYMIVSSALVVRNVYTPFINRQASERQCVWVARVTGVLMVLGSVLVSLFFMNVFQQLQLTWIFPILFASVFWLGMYWRRATTSAAWGTVGFVLLLFFILPAALPGMGDWRNASEYHLTNTIVETKSTRTAAPSDVAQRTAAIALWRQRNPDHQGAVPGLAELNVGDVIESTSRTGGKSVFWSEGVVPVDEQGNPLDNVVPVPVGQPEQVDDHTQRQVFAYPDDTRLQGRGNLRVDFLLYRLLPLDLSSYSSAMLNTLELPLKIVLPFAVMIGLSLITPRNSTAALDRYYAKMKTPVVPDPVQDQENLKAALSQREELESRKLLPHTDFELEKPDRMDVIGLIVCLGMCVFVIGLAIWMGQIGAS